MLRLISKLKSSQPGQHIISIHILSNISRSKKNKNFMTSFYGWGSTASRLEPLRGGSLLSATKFAEVPGTHFIDLGRMKGLVDLGATQRF